MRPFFWSARADVSAPTAFPLAEHQLRREVQCVAKRPIRLMVQLDAVDSLRRPPDLDDSVEGDGVLAGGLLDPGGLVRGESEFEPGRASDDHLAPRRTVPGPRDVLLESVGRHVTGGATVERGRPQLSSAEPWPEPRALRNEDAGRDAREQVKGQRGRTTRRSGEAEGYVVGLYLQRQDLDPLLLRHLVHDASQAIHDVPNQHLPAILGNPDCVVGDLVDGVPGPLDATLIRSPHAKIVTDSPTQRKRLALLTALKDGVSTPLEAIL